MEKNWKKMFSLRHKRLSKEEEDEQEPTSDANAAEEAPAAENEASTAESEAPKPEEKPRAEENVDEREDKEDKLASAKLQLLVSSQRTSHTYAGRFSKADAVVFVLSRS